jgi:putative acetyltransferase
MSSPPSASPSRTTRTARRPGSRSDERRRAAPLRPADAKRCAEIFRASIEELAAEDYDADQRDAWASRADDEQAFGARLASALTLLAVIDGEIAGFASLKDGEEIDMLFVDPEFARQGVGRTLLDALTRLAQARGAKRLSHRGERRRQAAVRAPKASPPRRRNLVRKGDQWLANTTMTKTLGPVAPKPRLQ